MIRYAIILIMIALYIILGLITLLILLFLLGGLFAYRIAFYNDIKYEDPTRPVEGPQFENYEELMQKMINASYQIPVDEEVDIKSYDHKKLHGYIYYAKEENKPWVIFVHGYKGSPQRDFSGGIPEFMSRGFNVLAIDHRGHAKSDGRTITFGAKEHIDLLGWIKYINDRFNNPDIVLYGISMGGHSVLLASGEKLTSNVKGIIADCPYTTPKAITLATSKQGGLSPHIAFPMLLSAATFFAHFNFLRWDARKAVRKSNVPILIYIGTEDKLVPPSMADEIKASNEKMITLFKVEGAPHGLSYIVDTNKVQDEVSKFLKKINVVSK